VPAPLLDSFLKLIELLPLFIGENVADHGEVAFYDPPYFRLAPLADLGQFSV